MTGKNRWAWAVGAFAALMIAMGNPGTAVAQQVITGDIGFGGLFKPANNSFASASLASATSIDFNGNGIQDVGQELVVLSTGDFATLAPVGSFASLSDFIFNPLSASGVSPLWSAGGFSFALDSISIDTQNANTLSLVGTGTVSGNSYTSSPGTWNLVAGPIGSSFLFMAGTGTVPAIPEPEIYAMMGIGLGLIGWLGRRKKLEKGAAA